MLATATPDQTFPASATRVQTALGIDDCIAFDVAAVCTGFLYALSVADNMLKGGMAEYALVIGSETFSRILDWEDRTTCVLFGDGAGAVLLRSVEAQDKGVLATKLHADGRHNDLLFVDGGVSTTGTVGKLRMKGQEVFRHAVVNLAAVLTETLEAAGHSADEVDWVVPHQANKRILDATAKKLGLDPARVDRHRRPACQHLGRLGAARARHGGPGRPDQARRPHRARGDGGRLHLGRRGRPLLRPTA